MSADLARVRSSKPTAPVWSALFNHSLFERNVMRIVAGFAVNEFSEGACLPACLPVDSLSPTLLFPSFFTHS
jgi:hypothetical protein